MITVKQIIKFLEKYPPDAEVKWHDGSEIKNLAMQEDCDVLILSDHRAIGYCLRCGSNVYKENIIAEYPAYCPTCDENKFSFEFEKKIREEDEQKETVAN